MTPHDLSDRIGDTLRRAATTAAALTAAATLAVSVTAPAAWAIAPPTVPADPPIPADPAPVADPPLKRDDNKPCNLPGVLPAPPVTDVAAAQTQLALDDAHKYSTGRDVTVAIIDTGVAPNPRLPRLQPAGDYVDPPANGLQDCDMHGTLVAGIIGAAPSPADPVVGVAPDANILSIRQSSAMWSLQNPSGANLQEQEGVGKIDALAAAIVHAANLGARVINMSVFACIPAAHPVDQTKLGIAVWYASVVKDVVLVAAAGNVGSGDGDCQSNPDTDPLTPEDPRNWNHVISVSAPSWYSDYVISVGAVDANGAAPDKTAGAAKFSMMGPWLSLAAPGVNVVTTGPDGNAVNAEPARDGLTNLFGTSFSAAYVSGTAALIRARFPELSAAQVRCRLTQTAHAGPRGVDNAVGYGLIDPVAALTYDLPRTCPRAIAETHREHLVLTPRPVPPDRGPHNWALAISVVILAVTAGPAVLWRSRRRSA
ncbi:type VII secretion system ESX-1 serine protease mycosin MycP1 [Mycobacterium avium subsp. hominissuis]|uniref:type VII secretion-associated serine protease mycosin n=1 Tax=Mycobacterium avium TaxID=1764 RepID=UPI00044FED40|nr:type VII secretion-associated serine protease mycosin [Mycobacterium avium]ETZ55246.1 type VII secretion-associated serine protease mycosin [Mycobacterium avium MAV_120709_2344]MDO2386117.1 type VII secretion-associated serine protease mycosin [Mycobacterium avium subsp. hominissuis]